MKKSFLLFFVFSIFPALLSGLILGLGMHKDCRQGALTESREVRIPAGSGTIQISEILEEEEILRFPKLFCLFVRRQGMDGIWHPGLYRIEPKSGYMQLCKQFSKYAYAPDISVTIPEGKQLKEIAKILSDARICEKDAFLYACEKEKFDYPFLLGTEREGRRSLEGYLFPDTYRFFPNTEPEVVIRCMLDRFQEKVYTAEHLSRAEELGYSFDELIILASMVESEAALESDRRHIAQVFFNRLGKTGEQMLQSCVTVEYALGIHKSIISWQDTQFDSPYNTYMYPGLPIGPICCPGLMSVRAALWPEENNYYYFQSDKFGKIWFASTLREHINIQNRVQKDWEVFTRIVGE
ncbi:MAG: endolytic transglycosylase MltG [Bacillota bacterium]|nr:endolytic transglycosylase MltG [Bacillota bacterium]